MNAWPVKMLVWLDADPWRYGVVATAAWAGSLGLALLPFLASVEESKVPSLPPPGASTFRKVVTSMGDSSWFCLSLLVTLLALRWPVLFVPIPLNPDENQLVTQAAVAASQPSAALPWRDFDNQTCGPFTAFAIVPLLLAGFPPGYGTARLTGLLLIGAALVGAYLALRRVFAEGVARVSVLPALGFFSLATFVDFLHDSSELLSVSLLLLAFAALAQLLPPARGADSRPLGVATLTAGTLLGAVPYAKIQAAPTALALAICGYGFILHRRQDSPRRRGQLALTLSAGGAVASVVLLTAVATGGALADFFKSYLLMPLHYTSHDHHPTALLWNMFTATGDFAVFFYPCLAVGALGVVMMVRGRTTRPPSGRTPVSPGQRQFTVAALVLLTVSFWSVLQPQRAQAHYLQYLILPTSVLSGCTLGYATASLRRRNLPGLVGIFLAVTLLPTVVHRLVAPRFFVLNQLPIFMRWPITPVADTVLRARSAPGENASRPDSDASMAVWGWAPELFVQTGLRPGTRDPNTHFQIQPSALQGYYRARYLADLSRRRPEFFVDAVAPNRFGYQVRALNGFETFPELARLIASEYRLVAEVDGVRIYQRIEPRTVGSS